jgi:hypothetical protein
MLKSGPSLQLGHLLTSHAGAPPEPPLPATQLPFTWVYPEVQTMLQAPFAQLAIPFGGGGGHGVQSAREQPKNGEGFTHAFKSGSMPNSGGAPQHF